MSIYIYFFSPDYQKYFIKLHFTSVILLSVIRITTCAASGRTGPTDEKCTEKYNNTNIELLIPSLIQEEKRSTFNLYGVQRWTAPRGEYYTLVDKSF